MKKLMVFAMLMAPISAFAAVASRPGAARRGGTAIAPAASSASSSALASSGGAAAPAPNAARAASTSKVLLFGGTSGTKSLESKADANVEGNPCKEAYWGCMDQFCMGANDNAGRCACSNDSVKLDKEYNAVMSAVETEVAKTAAVVDEIEYGGELNQGGRGDSGQNDGAEKEECPPDDIGCKVGAAKYNAAVKLCDAGVTQECKANFSFTKLQYSQNIRTDCAAYQVMIKDVKEKGAVAAAAARKEMREAAAEQFDAKNKFNESECMIELRKCMNRAEVCGEDWSRCAATGIEEKRFHCEKSVLDNCAAVRESVWDGFVADIAPALKSATITADNDRRQNCLTRISDCILNACRDNMAGKGETMDGCLARPEMAQSFCKVELDDCDGSGMMWPFVKSKLAAMRVDACTMEVKDCFTSADRCGPDWTNCIGMDYVEMHKMCPVDKLVVCRQGKADFKLADLNDMIAGVFLNMDNKLIDKCEQLVEEKTIEVCGSADACDAPFEQQESAKRMSDLVIWSSVQLAKGGEWLACKDKNPEDECRKFPRAGTLMIDEYMNTLGNRDEGDKTKIKADLDNANLMISTIISMVDDDPKISWCVVGRDMKQMGGKRQTMGRFPNLTTGVRMMIAGSGLRYFGRNKPKK